MLSAFYNQASPAPQFIDETFHDLKKDVSEYLSLEDRHFNSDSFADSLYLADKFAGLSLKDEQKVVEKKPDNQKQAKNKVKTPDTQEVPNKNTILKSEVVDKTQRKVPSFLMKAQKQEQQNINEKEITVEVDDSNLWKSISDESDENNDGRRVTRSKKQKDIKKKDNVKVKQSLKPLVQIKESQNKVMEAQSKPIVNQVIDQNPVIEQSQQPEVKVKRGPGRPRKIRPDAQQESQPQLLVKVDPDLLAKSEQKKPQSPINQKQEKKSKRSRKPLIEMTSEKDKLIVDGQNEKEFTFCKQVIQSESSEETKHSDDKLQKDSDQLKEEEEEMKEIMRQIEQMNLLDQEAGEDANRKSPGRPKKISPQTYELEVNLHYTQSSDPSSTHKFVFNRDIDGKYVLEFGDLKLQKFNYHRYSYIMKSHGFQFEQEMMRELNSKSDQLDYEEGKLSDTEQVLARNIKSDQTCSEQSNSATNNIKYQYKPIMSYEEFQKQQNFAEIFNLNDQKDVRFIQKWLLNYKPRWNDLDGWIYVYYRQADEILIKQNKLSHLILFKVGRTKNLPQKRVQFQADKNKEVYKIRETFASRYSNHLEFLIHLYFHEHRVVRPDMIDGKTEWFLVTYNELRDAILKIKLFMIRAYHDCGWEQLIPHETRINPENLNVAKRTRHGTQQNIQNNQVPSISKVQQCN
ncbi:UNKNOWN [Stylonychia lemnae]|uniref:Bacteriophage T5 Orf172 DNA-binding domain-containing protein n=1 Tax=Stylonychia lemnae TaxID=5949 RepID=A0A078ASV6_STYLE|nr:UNKNOWN [Stylonychia lemnae]|eukprot:CDW84297.1 UNKNOWN [Stylonychia lemnae]